MTILPPPPELADWTGDLRVPHREDEDYPERWELVDERLARRQRETRETERPRRSR